MSATKQPNQVWAILYRTGGAEVPWLVGNFLTSRSALIRDAMAVMPGDVDTWRKACRAGFRCARVTLTWDTP